MRGDGWSRADTFRNPWWCAGISGLAGMSCVSLLSPRKDRDPKLDALTAWKHRDVYGDVVLLPQFSATRPEDLWGPGGENVQPSVAVLRPFLSARKSQTLAYCRDRGLAHVEDASNRDLKYTRNAIRAFVSGDIASVGGPMQGDAFASDVARVRQICQAARLTLDFKMGELYTRAMAKGNKRYRDYRRNAKRQLAKQERKARGTECRHQDTLVLNATMQGRVHRYRNLLAKVLTHGHVAQGELVLCARTFLELLERWDRYIVDNVLMIAFRQVQPTFGRKKVPRREALERLYEAFRHRTGGKLHLSGVRVEPIVGTHHLFYRVQRRDDSAKRY